MYFVLTYVEGPTLREELERVRRATVRHPDPRSDLYSVGCVIFECLAGAPPYQHDDDRVVLRMHLQGPIPGVRRLRPLVPTKLARVVTKALAKNLEQRWQSAAGMRAALGECECEESAWTERDRGVWGGS